MIATIWASLNRFVFIVLPLCEKLNRILYFSLAYFYGKLSGSGYNNKAGNENTFIGYQAGYNSLIGGNTFVGARSGYANTYGTDNTFVGANAGEKNVGGSYNLFFGSQAGYSNTTASNNVFLGAQSGYANSTGSVNTFLGANAGRANTEGAYNLFIGGNTGQANTTGQQNIFLGAGSGYTNSTGSYNTFIGLNAGYANATGENNVFLGQRAGFSNTNGGFNRFLGASTGYSNTTGVYNTLIGNGAGYTNQTGSQNTFIGLNAGFKTTTSDNVSIGYNAGAENTTGTQNTFIGTNAGVMASNPDLQNATAIGCGALVATSNSVVLGANANVGISTAAPSARLHLVSSQDNTSGLRLEKLTSSSPASGGQTKFLTVDGSGNVILGTTGSGGRTGVEEALWQRTEEGLLKTRQDDGVVIGRKLGSAPAGYILFVEQGILTERVKVAVKNSAEWSDHVFGPSYRMRSLAEVERHIRQRGRLPGMASARQMVEQNNDLHRTDAKLPEKIEELKQLVKKLLEKR